MAVTMTTPLSQPTALDLVLLSDLSLPRFLAPRQGLPGSAGWRDTECIYPDTPMVCTWVKDDWEDESSFKPNCAEQELSWGRSRGLSTRSRGARARAGGGASGWRARGRGAVRSSKGPGQGRPPSWLVWERVEWRDAQARWERRARPRTAGVRREPGGRRHPRRRGRSRDRSCHPAAGPRQKTAARGRASSAPRHATRQCSEAPGGAADDWATDGKASGVQPRGEPTTLSPDPLAFCLANVAAQGLSRGRCGGQAGQPVLASPGVTGDRSERVESPDRVRWIVSSVQAPSREGWGVGGGVFNSFEKRSL